MEYHLSRCVGVHGTSLSYVVCKDIVRAGTVPPLETNLTHSTEHGSVEQELVSRLNHQNPLYCTENSKVYYKVEEAVRGTIYALTIKSFSRTKDGQGYLEALTKKFAVTDKWQADLSKCKLQVTTSQCKGQSSYFLGKYANQHRNSHVSIQDCATRVPFQLTDETTRLQNFLNGIVMAYSKLNYVIYIVHNDKAIGGQNNIPPLGILHYFEDSVLYVLPSYPVARIRKDVPGGGRKEIFRLFGDTTPQGGVSIGGRL